MEYAVFKLNIGNIRDELSDVNKLLKDISEGKGSRIYWGSELCAKRLPSIPEMKEGLRHINKMGLALTYVTPAMLNDSDIIRLKETFAYLNQHGKVTEVVINDWGALQLILEYKYLVPLIGRLLDKREKDPRVNYRSLNRHQKNVLGSTALSQAMTEFLKTIEVERIEYDNSLQEINKRTPAPKFKISLYYPFVAVSFSRICLFAGTSQPKKLKFRSMCCRKECLDYILKREFWGAVNAKEFTAWQIGKGIYYENFKIPKNLAFYDRIVLTVV